MQVWVKRVKFLNLTALFILMFSDTLFIAHFPGLVSERETVSVPFVFMLSFLSKVPGMLPNRSWVYVAARIYRGKLH